MELIRIKVFEVSLLRLTLKIWSLSWFQMQIFSTIWSLKHRSKPVVVVSYLNSHPHILKIVKPLVFDRWPYLKPVPFDAE